MKKETYLSRMAESLENFHRQLRSEAASNLLEFNQEIEYLELQYRRWVKKLDDQRRISEGEWNSIHKGFTQKFSNTLHDLNLIMREMKKKSLDR